MWALDFEHIIIQHRPDTLPHHLPSCRIQDNAKWAYSSMLQPLEEKNYPEEVHSIIDKAHKGLSTGRLQHPREAEVEVLGESKVSPPLFCRTVY